MPNFTKVLYVSDSGKKYKIRMSTTDVAAQTTAPGVGAPDVPGIAKTSKSTKSTGLHPRKLRLSRTAGTAPNLKTYYNSLVVCAVADVTALQTAGSVTINGVAWTVGSLTGETIR